MKDPFNGVKYTFLMALYVSLKYLITKRFTSHAGKFYTKIRSNNAVFGSCYFVFLLKHKRGIENKDVYK